jgi:hypothetical protein
LPAPRRAYYPEFPDASRRRASSGSADRWPVTESFGTLRYGRLLELHATAAILDVDGSQRHVAPLIVEEWLKARMAGSDAIHAVNMCRFPGGRGQVGR